MDLSPRQIVGKLDKYIIGQDEAKKAVAIALRNRYRRAKLPQEIREEITPKNIIMKGPTGVGKTEIARRLAKLVKAPFVKVEATKYTEVGYVGKDVEGMIRDLAECAYRLVKAEKEEEVRAKATVMAEKRIVRALPTRKKKKKGTRRKRYSRGIFSKACATVNMIISRLKSRCLIRRSKWKSYPAGRQFPSAVFLAICSKTARKNAVCP